MHVEEIVLYHGSLNELNKIGKGTYRVASPLEFVSEKIVSVPEKEIPTLSVRSEVLRKGFHGLVNKRTIYTGVHKGATNYIIEGTPVIRVES